MDRSSYLTDIEKIAAFLDGNLPDEEMLQITESIADNEMLSQIKDASDFLEDKISEYSEEDLRLPFDLNDVDFCFPDLTTSSGGIIELSPMDLNLHTEVITPNIEHDVFSLDQGVHDINDILNVEDNYASTTSCDDSSMSVPESTSIIEE